MNYYNDNNAFCCDWLRNLIAEGLIPDGKVDDRDIRYVQPADLMGFDQCHFFAGVGGWPLALQWAGWPTDREVWTGSCPCQPFSAAGKRQGTDDPRHLWPEFFRLVRDRRPPVVMGEQVAGKGGLAWLDGVFADLESATYACLAADTCAASVGAPHIRQRLFWLADTQSEFDRRGIAGTRGRLESPDGRNNGGLAIPNSPELRREPSAGEQPIDEQDGGAVRMGHAGEARLQVSERAELSGTLAESQGRAVEQPGGAWADCYVIDCLDGKRRRVGTGLFPLAYGLPRGMGRVRSALSRLALLAATVATLGRAKRNRVGRLQGYGNSIVPQVAAEFIQAYMESQR